MRRSTGDFARLYGIVSQQLSSLAVDSSWRQRPDREWLAYLIIVFQQLFEDWEHDEGLTRYLAGLESSHHRRVHRVFRLAGHVYLHVAYDLVRGVAGTLATTPPTTGTELHIAASRPDTFRSPRPVVASSRPDARLTFLAMAPAFTAALESRAALDLLGDVTPWARLLGVMSVRKRRLALQIMAQWVLQLRNAALITAETIADSPPPQRTRIVNSLRVGIENALNSVPERSKLTDFRPLGFPILDAGAPLALLAVGMSQDFALVIAFVVAAGWIWMLGRVRRRQRLLLHAINALGVAMHEALINARREGESSQRFPG